MSIERIADNALIISKNITELISAHHYYDQLLGSDEAGKQECINTMIGCAERIRKAGLNIYGEVHHIQALFNS